MSLETGEGNSFCTPRRAQKCLFGSVGSSNKKSTHRSKKETSKENDSSSEDSDLGPMSPLALTDRSPSSCSSSPGRHFVSPFATPEELSPNTRASWDRLTSGSKNERAHGRTSPFSTLRKLTRAARYSPRRKLIPGSPQSIAETPLKSIDFSTTPSSPEIPLASEEVVPETPHRNFGRELQNGITETPRKSDSPEHKLITPLGFENKMLPLPKLHRRKSLSMFETAEGSPERKEKSLKRHAHETLGSAGAKLQKTDENCSIPKARAALFQDEKSEKKSKDFTLNTKSFYSSSEKRESFGGYREFRDNQQGKKRRSLPLHNSGGRRSKRFKSGAINAGVSHGIRKPKPKRSVDNTKKETPETQQNPEKVDPSPPKTSSRKQKNTPVVPAERAPSPEVDPTKRFFKTNRTVKQNHTATVTVNNKIKLKVADGKIALNQAPVRHVHKRPKHLDISFDTTDLTVDEPDVEASLEQSKVANILKVLEDDWADDDYDTMETLTNQRLEDAISPLKPTTMLTDVTMSPASQLSNMTSIMNIEDISAPTTFENIVSNNAKNNDNQIVPEPKYYPLFTKGYSANKVFEDSGNSKPSRGKENLNWQFSTKGGENQYQLDAGQKRFGATQCPECGVIYQLGEPEDENAHLNYHNSIKTLKFPGWKTERVIMEDAFTSSRIILVEPGDPKQYWNKVSDILAVVDRDLGLVDAKLPEYQDKKVYLYIRDKCVLGVLVAESIKTAHRMIPELLELDCCTAESTPAKCGINVVWTAMSHRKQGIGRKLVDVLRAHYYYGYIMSLDDIAFSIPTPSGKIFAEKYTKTRNFKVYS